MQEPSTGSGSCNGVAIYEECDELDVNWLNAITMEFDSVIKKFLPGESFIPFDCANPASYDQLCRAIQAACEKDDQEECPPASDFTISPDGTTATYNGTETNVQMCYFDNDGNSPTGSGGICFVVPTGTTVSLSHANFNPFAIGGLEVFVNALGYSGTPPPVPGSTGANGSASGIVAGGWTLDGSCPGITLETTQSDGFGGTTQIISSGAFSYA